jgi:hypothetical protein
MIPIANFEALERGRDPALTLRFSYTSFNVLSI